MVNRATGSGARTSNTIPSIAKNPDQKIVTSSSLRHIVAIYPDQKVFNSLSFLNNIVPDLDDIFTNRICYFMLSFGYR